MADKSALKGKCFSKTNRKEQYRNDIILWGEGGGTEKDVIIGIIKYQMQAGNFMFLYTAGLTCDLSTTKEFNAQCSVKHAIYAFMGSLPLEGCWFLVN